MRIWHVYASPRSGPVNGVVQAVHQLATAQRAAGMEVEVLHGTADDPRRGPASGTARGLAREAHRLAAIAPADLIHLHELFRPPHLVLGPHLRRTPYVVSLHGATAPPNLARYPHRKAAWSRLVERRIVASADAVLALTWQERNQAYRWSRELPVMRVVANVADPLLLEAPGWAPPARGPGEPARVVTLARWDVRHKGLDRAAELAALAPEVRFDVHGGPCGNEPDLLGELRRTAPANLALLDPVHGAAKVAALRSARAFLLLSRWEGLAMALLEAMALGVPCLTSAEVAATLGRAAPVITLPDDPARAAALVREVLADEPRLEATGRAGRRWVREHAAAPVVAGATEELYHQVLATRPRAGALAKA